MMSANKPSQMSREEVEDEVAAIRDENSWPLWPILPMKNCYRKWTEPNYLGILLAGSTVVYTGPHTMFDLVPNVKLSEQLTPENGWVKEQFATVQEMVEAGWVGD